MKHKILPLIFSSLCMAGGLQAQSKKAFAVTSDTRGTFAWNTIREIDMATGETVRTFYDKNVHDKFEIVNNLNARVAIDANGRTNTRLMPMAEGVAATAYDEKNNRLYYTTMRGNELRYFDLNNTQGKIVYQQSQLLFDGNRMDEANVITRMAFASDGHGYAITNDGKNLLRFTTDQKPEITNLGELIDGKNNGTVSVHNLCSSWGGDMVGDAYGNLYVISMRNHVFKVNPKTRIADHLGIVKGLPAEYTTNGMAVDADGEVLLSSAAIAGTYYRLNISTMEAVAVKNNNSENVYNASDLASSNLLYQKRLAPVAALPVVMGNNEVSIYPNPVSNKMLSVRFDKVPAGKYNLAMMDASGKVVMARSLVINYLGQLERINLPRSSTGMYLFKLTGSDSKVVFNDKIVVQ